MNAQEQIQRLPEEFTKNGNNYRLYRRGTRTLFYAIVDTKGRELDYEVFLIKIQSPGEKFGKWYPERERFPTSEAFGKWAVWCKDIDRATTWFEGFEKGHKQRSYGEIQAEVDPSSNPRGVIGNVHAKMEDE